MLGRFHCYIKFVLLLSLSLYLDTKQGGDNQATFDSKYYTQTIWSWFRILYVLTLQCQPPLGLHRGLVVLYRPFYPLLRQLIRTRRSSSPITPISNLFCLSTLRTRKKSWGVSVKHTENEYVDGWHARLFPSCHSLLYSLFSGRRPTTLWNEASLPSRLGGQPLSVASRGALAAAEVWGVESPSQGLSKEEKGAGEKEGHVWSDFGGSEAPRCVACLPRFRLAFDLDLYWTPTSISIDVPLHVRSHVISDRSIHLRYFEI